MYKRQHPVIEEDAIFDTIYDYPKREVEEYRFAVEKGEREEVTVVECHYKLESDDIKVIADVFGSKALKSNIIIRRTFYGEKNSKFQLNVNEANVREHLSTKYDFPTNLKEGLLKAKDWKSYLETLSLSLIHILARR